MSLRFERGELNWLIRGIRAKREARQYERQRGEEERERKREYVQGKQKFLIIKI